MNKHCRPSSSFTRDSSNLLPKEKDLPSRAESVAALRVMSSCDRVNCVPFCQRNLQGYCGCMTQLIDPYHNRVTHCGKCSFNALWDLESSKMVPIPVEGEITHWVSLPTVLHQIKSLLTLVPSLGVRL